MATDAPKPEQIPKPTKGRGRRVDTAATEGTTSGPVPRVPAGAKPLTRAHHQALFERAEEEEAPKARRQSIGLPRMSKLVFVIGSVYVGFVLWITLGDTAGGAAGGEQADLVAAVAWPFIVLALIAVATIATQKLTACSMKVANGGAMAMMGLALLHAGTGWSIDPGTPVAVSAAVNLADSGTDTSSASSTGEPDQVGLRAVHQSPDHQTHAGGPTTVNFGGNRSSRRDPSATPREKWFRAGVRSTIDQWDSYKKTAAQGRAAYDLFGGDDLSKVKSSRDLVQRERALKHYRGRVREYAEYVSSLEEKLRWNFISAGANEDDAAGAARSAMVRLDPNTTLDELSMLNKSIGMNIRVLGLLKREFGRWSVSGKTGALVFKEQRVRAEYQGIVAGQSGWIVGARR